MRNFFESIVNSLRNFFSRLTKREKIRIAVIAGAIVVLAIAIAAMLSYVKYTVLYANLPDDKAGQVISVLDEMAVPYQTRGTGTILVPDDQVSSLSMKLANTDSLKQDGFNIEEYSALVNNMTTTDQERRVYWQYSLSEMIRERLVQNSGIEDAWVIVTLPERSSFVLKSGQTESQVSVALSVLGGRRLTDDEVQGIAEFLKGSVPDLTNENIKIIDTGYNFYDLEDRPLLTDIDDQLAYTRQVQEMLEETVSKLLIPIFGYNGFRVVVTPTLDFDSEVKESTTWAPPVADMNEGLVISASRMLELVRPGFTEGDVPGTDTNGLGTVEYPYGDINDDEEYRKAVDETNYELNEFHSVTEKAMGKVLSLSVAVTIDSNIAPDEIVEDVSNLIGGAIGVAPKAVTVVRRPFLENTEVAEGLELQRELERQRQSSELIRMIIIIVCVLLAVVLLALVLVSIVRSYNRRIETETRALSAQLTAEAAAAQAAAGQFGYIGGNVDYMIAGDGQELDENGMPIKPIDAMAGKSDLLFELEDFIERDPASAAAMLRNWLTEEQ